MDEYEGFWQNGLGSGAEAGRTYYGNGWEGECGEVYGRGDGIEALQTGDGKGYYPFDYQEG